MFFPHALGLWQSWKCGHSWNVLFSWFLLVNLAIATIAFHGTLKRWGQMYDESIMFMSQAQMLNCLMICKQISGKKRAAFCTIFQNDTTSVIFSKPESFLLCNLNFKSR